VYAGASDLPVSLAFPPVRVLYLSFRRRTDALAISEHSSSKIKIGIVGGTGYTGGALVRLLAAHPPADLQAITSRGDAGLSVADLFPSLRGHYALCFSEPDPSALAACDLVFFATPTGIASDMAPQLLDAGVRIIDLAADFRIKDAQVWERWYGKDHGGPHKCPELLAEAVYGLPEVNREQIDRKSVVEGKTAA